MLRFFAICGLTLTSGCHVPQFVMSHVDALNLMYDVLGLNVCRLLKFDVLSIMQDERVSDV